MRQLLRRGLRGPGIPVLVLVLIGLTGLALLLWVTATGIGLYYDSMPYLEAAQNLVAGHGLGRISCETFKPLTRYPPFYSLLLAAPTALHVDLYSGARFISASALGLVCVLVGLTVLRATRNWPLALLGAGWVIVSVPVLNVFSWAMSEPVYVALWLGSLLVLDTYLASVNRRVLLVAAGLASLAFLTRYIGALPIGASLIVLVVEASGRRIPWRDVGVYLAVACTPMLLWLGRGILVAGNPTSRSLAGHLPERDVLRQGAATVVGWFGSPQAFPSEEALAAALAGILLIFAMLSAAVFLRRSQLASGSRLVVLHVLTSLVYGVGVVVSISFFDPRTPLDDRILIPIYLSMGIVLVAMLHNAVRLRLAVVAAMALALFLALMVRQGSQLGEVVARLRAEGQGYASSRWTQSEVARRLRELGPAVIYTNDITAVFFIAHAPSCAVPTSDAEEALTVMRERLKGDDAVLAIFGELSSEFMALDRLTRDLVVYEALHDGTIYRTRPSGMQ